VAELRQIFRDLKVLQGPFLPFDPTNAPADPLDVFLDWLSVAIAHDVPEPHAMTLATAGADGRPDARILLLKNVDGAGFHFAISAASRKGRQLEQRPSAALTFYWQPLARQVRVRGEVVYLGAEASAADFRARPDGSRAAGMLGRQSETLECAAELDEAYARALVDVAQNPEAVSPHWRLYAVRPDEVEFWQGASSRRHTRLRYTRRGDDFRRDILWP
jgi:pyridoxamine 5'-phosphate oxidase